MPVLVTFCAYWLAAIPLAWVLGFAFDLGAVGVWGGLALGLALSAFCLVWRLRLVLRAKLGT